MILSLIAAASDNNVIGKDGALPWSLPNDLRYFRDRTRGKPVIMGRGTFRSLPHPLPDRENIVLTREKDLEIPGATVVHTLHDAISHAKTSGTKEAFIIGGGAVFAEALPLADRIYLTRVHADVEGDTFFPILDPAVWREISRDEHQSDARHPHDFTFLIYERIH